MESFCEDRLNSYSYLADVRPSGRVKNTRSNLTSNLSTTVIFITIDECILIVFLM